MNQSLTRYGFLSIGIGVIIKCLGMMLAAFPMIPGMFSSVPKQCDLLLFSLKELIFLVFKRIKKVVSYIQLVMEHRRKLKAKFSCKTLPVTFYESTRAWHSLPLPLVADHLLFPQA